MWQLLIVNPRVMGCGRLGRLKAAPHLSVDVLTVLNKLFVLGCIHRKLALLDMCGCTKINIKVEFIK